MKTIRGKITTALAVLATSILSISGVSLWGLHSLSSYELETIKDYNELRAILDTQASATIFMKELNENNSSLKNNSEYKSAKEAWRTQIAMLARIQQENHPNGEKKIYRIENLARRIMTEADQILLRKDPKEAKDKLEALNEELFDGEFLSLLGEFITKEQAEVTAIQQMTQQLTSSLLELLIGFALVTLAFSVYLSRALISAINKPLQQLLFGTEELAKGNLNHRIQLEGTDEFAIFSAQFDDMAGRLHSATLLAADAKAKEETLRLHEEFLSIVSHELRTPVNAILGFTELLSDGVLTPQQQQNTKKISECAERQLRLINAILDFSKLKAGKTEVYPELIDLPGLLNDTLQEARSIARGLPLDIRLEISPDLSTILSDELKLKQILGNLTSNAIKFTPKGEILIKAERAGEDLTIQIQDCGIGIPFEQQQEIFEPFRQAHKPQHEGQGSTGLGLAIVKDLVVLLHGKIDLESAPDKGSTFIVTLPLSNAEMAYFNTQEKDTPHGQDLIY